MFESLEGHAQQLVEFVRIHEAWAAPIVFALAFGESLAFISLLIPAWSALIGIGALIGMSGIDFTPIWIGAALGAALGDWLSYWLGTTGNKGGARVWPVSPQPGLPPRC